MTSKKRIGEMLLEAGIIDETQLKAALGHQRQWGVRLGQALVDLKLATEADIVRALSLKFGFEVAKLDALEPYGHEQALKLFPREFVARNNVFPMWADTANVTVAMSDPTNLAVVDEVRFRTGRRVKVCIGGDQEVAEAVKRHYPADGAVEAIALDLDADGDAEMARDAVFDPFGGGSKDALEAFFGGGPDAQSGAPIIEPFALDPTAGAPAAHAPPPPAPAVQAAPAAPAAARPQPTAAPRPAAKTASGIPAQPPAPRPAAAPAPARAAPAAPAKAPAAAPARSAAPAPPPPATAAAAPARAATQSRSAPSQPTAAARPAPVQPSPARAPAAPAAPARATRLEIDLEEPPTGAAAPAATRAEQHAPLGEEQPQNEPVLASDLAPEEMVEGPQPSRDLDDRELAILESLDRLADGAPAEPDVVKPAQAMAAMIRLLIRKRIVSEQDFLDELSKK